MSRHSEVHYIAPSAISITPNANHSANDLAVYVPHGATVKVYSPAAGIDFENNTYQEWVFAGRNRRLADSAKPYTIYVRLPKEDKTDGYLIFAAKDLRDGEWIDRYCYVTPDGITKQGYDPDTGKWWPSVKDELNWYIRLGEVSLPNEDNQRTVDLDTGILGTDQYNSEWAVDPDSLPLRVEIGCTIDDEDTGASPYVNLGKYLVLTASLVKGFETTEIENFDHWEISRIFSDGTPDLSWPDTLRRNAFRSSGSINICHVVNGVDDFSGSAAMIFKVTAMGTPEDGSSEEIVPLVSASITISAETLETYELVPSTSVVTYDDATEEYVPNEDITVRVRATDSLGNIRDLTYGSFAIMGLAMDLEVSGFVQRRAIPIGGSNNDTVSAIVPISTFSHWQNVDLRLTRIVDNAEPVLATTTIAFIPTAEDSREREWIFLRSQTEIHFGDAESEYPEPSLIEGGEVNPEGPAAGDDHDPDQDDWVPEGWYDEEQKATSTYYYIYAAYRDYVIEGEDSGHWGPFTKATLWDHYTDGGEDAYVASANPPNVSFDCDVYGDSIDTLAKEVVLTMYKGADSVPFTTVIDETSHCDAVVSEDGTTLTVTSAGHNLLTGGYVFVTLTSVDGVSRSINIPVVGNRVAAPDEYLSKTKDDTAAGEIGFLKGLWIKAKGLFGFDEDGNIVANNISSNADVDVSGTERVDKIQSHNYSGSGLADTGFLVTNDDGTGSSLGVFDYLTIRKKMIVNSLEIKETHYTSGDVAQTLASAEIARTDYYYVDPNGGQELLGYSSIVVPWTLKGAMVALARFDLKGLFGHYKKVRMTLTSDELLRCNRVRCYFLAKDGDKSIENWFRPGDLVRCQTWNVLKTKRETFIPDFEEKDGNVFWWRELHDVSWNTGETRYVAKDAQGNPTDQTTTNPNQAYVNEGGVERLYDNGIYHTKGTAGYADHQPVTIDGNTYHWFDVEFDYQAEQAGGTSSAAAHSDIPAAGDKVVQFGNTVDPDRMNIVLSEVNGSGNPDAPAFKMLRGVYTFNLDHSWWGGTTEKVRISPATGTRMYAPMFEWITEVGVARQINPRPEHYWTEIALERDDRTNTTPIANYPDYSDDIVSEQGVFISRGGFVMEDGVKRYGTASNPIPKNYVRKCYYYDQVSHRGSMWLTSFAERRYWRDQNGNEVSERQEGQTYTYARSYTAQEPTPAANEWTEQVEKGDSGVFKSSVFCRNNTQPATPSNEKTDGHNTYDDPTPPEVFGQPTWTDDVPDGTGKVWMSTAWFDVNGIQGDWSTPRLQADSETLDIEFSSNSSQPSAPYNIDLENRGNGTRYGTYGTNSRANGSGLPADWYDPVLDANNSNADWSNMKWRAERQISNGAYIGQWAVSRIKGENAVRIDLTNENDSILYDNNGKKLSGNVTSVARLWDGATEVSDNTRTSWSVSTSGCTLSSASDSRYITVTAMTASEGSVTVTATYTDANGTSYTRSSVLTLKKLVDTDKYDLDISPNALFINTTDGWSSSKTLSVKVMRTPATGGTPTAVNPSDYNLSLSATRGSWSGSWPNGRMLTITQTQAKNYENTVVILYATGDTSKVHDRETIPFNKAENGKSITKKSETYRYATNNTGVRPAATSSDWSTTKPTLEKGYWLYTETTITWSDNSVTVLYTDERNPNDGIKGQDIIVDGSTVMKYYVGTSNTTHPAEDSSDWKDLNQVTQTQGKWLWSQATTWYRKADSTAGAHDAGKNVTYNVSYISKDGRTGRGISSITEYYQATNSSDARQAPTSADGWSTDPNLSDLTDKWDADHKYLWNMEVVVYSNADDTETTEYTIPQILAIWTEDGDPGQGIDSIQNKYCVTNTISPVPIREHETGGAAYNWSNTPKTPAQGQYLWNYEVITWVNPSKTTYTDVQMIGYAGQDGHSPSITIQGGYWYIDGQPTGVKAEGTDGTGVEIKGTVASRDKLTLDEDEKKGYAVPMNSDGTDGQRVEVKHGDCYICDSNRHLYMFTKTPSLAWNDLGEFKGAPGKNSYMHIAYADNVVLSGGTVTSVTGFTVVNTGKEYDWWGFCTDNDQTDPGAGASTDAEKLAAAKKYKWNYMKGKDGNGYERIYLFCKEGFTPEINQSSGSGSPSDDEFLPNVGNYTGNESKCRTSQWTDDPEGNLSPTWPVLWWSERKLVINDATGKGSWGNFCSPTIHNTYTSSPWIADLDNEMDSIACDSNNKPVKQQTVTTNVNLFYGSQKKAFTTAVAGYTRGTESSGITVSWGNYSAGTADDSDTITVAFATTATVSEKKEFEITLTAKDDNTVQRKLTLTVNGLKGGATYNLIPSDSYVVLNKRNQYVPSTLTCAYNKLDVAKGDYVTPSGGTIKYTKDGDDTKYTYSAALTPGTSFTSDVTFLLYVGSALVDRETVHIVKDGNDGLSQQSYMQVQEAWSNDASSANAATAPTTAHGKTDGTSTHPAEVDWTDSTPANTNSYAYLWRRSRLMTLKDDKSGYNAGNWTYTRLSGTNGTSINIKDIVASVVAKNAALPTTGMTNGDLGIKQEDSHLWKFNGSSWAVTSTAASDGDSYSVSKSCVIDLDGDGVSENIKGHLVMWSDEASKWIDIGQFQGQDAVQYYTHIAWAKGITIGTPTYTPTANQKTTPNASACEGFHTSPLDGYDWMGTLIDSVSDDCTNWQNYTWKYTKGNTGAPAGNTATVYLYKNSTSPVSSVGINTTLYYKFSTRKLYTTAECTTEATTQLNGWNLAVPSGNGQVYVTAAVAYSNATVDSGMDVDDIGKNEWVTPAEFSGEDGINSATVFLYKRSSSVPAGDNACPSQTLYYKFADGELYTTAELTTKASTQLNGWQREVPATDGNPCYIIQAAALSTSAYDAIEKTTTKNDWSSVRKLVEDGEPGKNSVRLALDNEHEDFMYDGVTLVAPSGGATSPIRLYDGVNPITDFTPVIDWTKTSGVENSTSGAYINSRVLYVKALSAATAEVVVKTTYGDADYYTKFTANKTNQDKYDISVYPSAVAYNPATYQTQSIQVSATGIGIGGTPLTAAECVISTTANSGKLRLFWAYVNANGSLSAKTRKLGTSFSLTANECASYVGLYIELRCYSNASAADTSTSYRLCDYETVEIAKVENGASSLIVDLDNESDQFGTDSNDVVQGEQVRSTGVTLYYGTQPQSFLASGGLTAQLFYASDNNEQNPINDSNIATVTPDGTDGTVTVTIKNNAVISDTGIFAKITAKCAKDTTGKVAYFNISKVKSGAPGKAPDICNLRPTTKSISFNKSELAGTTPKRLGCGYTLVKDTGTTNAETAESVVVNGTTYYIYWRYAGGSYSRFVPTGSSASVIWATGIYPSTTEKGVEFCLSSATTASGITTANTLDTENVPIVKDGVNGSATFHEIQSSQASVIVGAESTQAVINANFIFRLNTSGVYSAYSCYYAVYRRKGGAYTLKESSNAKATTGSYSETVSNYTTVDAWVVVMSDDVITSANSLPSSFLAKLEIPVEKQGARGDDGYTISVNPVGVTITQDSSGNFDVSSSVPAYVDVKITKGNDTTTNLVSAVAIASNQCADDTTKPIVVATVPDNTIRLKVTGVGRDAAESKYTQGSVVLTVTADGKTFSITVPVAVNYLGTYIQTIFTDRKEELAYETKTLIDEEGRYVVNDSTYQSVVTAAQTSMEWINTVNTPAATVANYNTRISNAEANISTITKKVNDGKNLFTGVLTGVNWKSVPSLIPATGQTHGVTLDANGYMLRQSGDTYIRKTVTLDAGKEYTVSFNSTVTTAIPYVVTNDLGQRLSTDISGNIPASAATTLKQFSFTVDKRSASGDTIRVYVCLSAANIFHPQIELGGTATAFESGDTEISSQIKQTADAITATVQRDYATKSELQITADGITADVSALKAGKNLIKNLTSGWVSDEADTSSIKYGDNFKIEDTDNDMYSPVVTLESNTDYCFSAYFDKTPRNDSSYALAPASGSYANGYALYSASASTSYSPSWNNSGNRYYFTFKTGSSAVKFALNLYFGVDCILYSPQLERGTTPTEFDARTIEVSSKIQQTADRIQLTVKDDFKQAGIEITSSTITLQAAKVYINNGSTTAAMFSGGKIDANYINATQVVTNALTSGTITAGSAKIDGLQAINVDVSGKITATDGTIGGFEIGSTYIKSTDTYHHIELKSDGSATLGGFKVATNGTASLTSTMTVGNTTSQRIEIIPFANNQTGSGSINFINAESDKVLKIGFYNDNYGSIDFYSPATKQNPEESEVSVRSNYLQIYSENTDNGKESYITMLTSTNNAYSQYTFDDKVNKMFLTSGVEGGTLMLRAYKPNGSSAWPVCPLDPNGANWMDKGHVHVMTMAELKVLLDNPNNIYYNHLANYAVMLTRINGD